MKRPTRLPVTRAVLCGALLAAAPTLFAQDPGRALGGLLRGLGGNLQIGNLAPAGNQGAQPTDLLKMLSESMESIDEPKEIEIGRQLAAVLLGSKPLSRDMALQRYVNQLGRWISLQSSRPHLPWTFGVINDPGFNAFAAPGGYVFVTKGLIDRVDESELAGILAHEITHVEAKHHLKALRSKARAGLFAALVGSQVRGSAAAQAISAQMLALGKDLYGSGLDQADEFESDRQGVALAARAGFDPYGLPAVLQQLRTATPENPLFSLTLSTHPPAQQRLDQLEQAMGQRLDSLAGKPVVRIADRLR